MPSIRLACCDNSKTRASRLGRDGTVNATDPSSPSNRIIDLPAPGCPPPWTAEVPPGIRSTVPGQRPDRPDRKVRTPLALGRVSHEWQSRRLMSALEVALSYRNLGLACRRSLHDHHPEHASRYPFHGDVTGVRRSPQLQHSTAHRVIAARQSQLQAFAHTRSSTQKLMTERTCS